MGTGGKGTDPRRAYRSAYFDEEINFIIGYPPQGATDKDYGTRIDTVIKNSMPLVHIQPGIPNFTLGLDLMRREPAFRNSSFEDQYASPQLDRLDSRSDYVTLLRKLGFSLKQPKPNVTGFLSCAYLADSFPTDTFTNEYGENFLQKMTNVGGEGLHGITQMLGGRSLTDTIDQMAKGGGVVGTGAKAVKGGLDMLGSMAQEYGGPTLNRIVNNANVLAAGGRIDFPMLWKNSTYTPSYTMTIRLYNPNPNSERATAKYIIGPIAALLLLGLPQSVGEGAYSWPFIHQFWSPGIYNLDPGYIASVTVVKGGDQQQISWKQRMGVVDVRIDFGSVFNSILSASSASRQRPTLKGYLNAMADEKFGVVGITDFSKVNNETDQSPATIQKTKNIGANAGGLTNSQIKDYQQNLSARRGTLATTQSKTQLDLTEVGETIKARVSKDIKEIADNLIGLIPTGVKISF